MPDHQTTSPPLADIWLKWRTSLRRVGAERYIAILLEALGPLNLVGAQFLYFSQPFVPGRERKAEWQLLARLLEDGEARNLFAQFLQERDSP